VAKLSARQTQDEINFVPLNASKNTATTDAIKLNESAWFAVQNSRQASSVKQQRVLVRVRENCVSKNAASKGLSAKLLIVRCAANPSLSTRQAIKNTVLELVQ